MKLTPLVDDARNRLLRLGLPALAALLLASGCSAGWLSSSGHEPSEAERLVARADTLAGTGWEHAARALYERVLREYPGDPAAAPALYNLGRLQVDPTSGFRNYRAAHATFSRLLTDFPKSRWEAAALKLQVQWREEETTRHKQQLRWREEEGTRIKSQLQFREEEASGLKTQ